MPRRDVASRSIRASVTDVYSALVDPEALSYWLPPGDMTGTFDRFDPRPGGTFELVLRYPDELRSQGKTTSDTDVVEARFLEVEPNARIVFAVTFASDDPDYEGTMIMSWSVTATAGGTLVEITADNVPDAISAEDHASGMNSSLEKLAGYLTD